MRALTALAAMMVLAPSAVLADAAGKPEEWQFGYQIPVTQVARDTFAMSEFVHWIAALITVFVTILLVYTCWKFSAKRNPEPQKFSHNTTIEVAWTVIPVLILVVLAVPSIRLLYEQETVPPSTVTVKAIGHQWYWEYMYDIDGEEVYVDSGMAGYGYTTYDKMVAGMKADGYSDDEIPTAELWKLEATAPMVVPVGEVIRVQVTAGDVLHAYALPSFGIKTDAVPGRLNETWFRAEEEGTYYGQCSELCGKDHSYMPIKVEVVSREEYNQRLIEMKEEYASVKTPDITLLASLAAE